MLTLPNSHVARGFARPFDHILDPCHVSVHVSDDVKISLSHSLSFDAKDILDEDSDIQIFGRDVNFILK